MDTTPTINTTQKPKKKKRNYKPKRHAKLNSTGGTDESKTDRDFSSKSSKVEEFNKKTQKYKERQDNYKILQNEMKLCQYKLPTFKLFKKSQYVYLYSLDIKESHSTYRALLSIPKNYPSNNLKLNKVIRLNGSSSNKSNVVELDTIIVRNFNYKAKFFWKNKHSLFVQLNYLINSWSELSNTQFTTLDKLKHQLLTELVDDM
ncbi:Smu2p SCDLUD_005319 [Saccharomycodes ludwigii]|uniref:Smu2p n=1 Tax=Saccharomycodes ludwigii TaxID=36035 RepID=UPI001E82DE1A|nr:hypothetical protein SCDLUD_005319 [Saccharomycodes ludwigii]KAH3898972.1 hypothetical protein SCDLUD_005319 [Saccharomycodes ludwigii]